MKDPIRKRRPSSFFPSFLLLLCFLLFFTTFRLFGVSFRPVLISTWPTPTMNAISTEEEEGDSLSIQTQTQTQPVVPEIEIEAAVSFPDLVLVFIKNPLIIEPNSNLQCLYYPKSSTSANLKVPPMAFSDKNLFVRCPLPSNEFFVSLAVSPLVGLPPVKPLNWDRLVYSAVLDHRDNTTLVFAKGFNLRSARLADTNRFECLFGWNLSKPKFRLATEAISVAQEIFRCKTPLSLLSRIAVNPPLVSIKTKGRRSLTLPSVARPQTFSAVLTGGKKYNMCVCTMVRNQARFLREWIAYHSRIGVERWFIYDNNSDDDIEEVVRSMGLSVSLHEWPWIKSQEAGFAHCALRARDSCEWVGFIDVDEFLYLPSNVTLHNVLQNYSGQPSVGELRTACHSFGPSGRKTIPSEGVMVGYTCRMAAPERHKSIVRPDALNPSLINVVHHFHLREGKTYVNLETRVMLINHYKYQVWEVFKEKFYRRVATYVADWQDEENVGSKDRAPGLGTKAVEPADWPNQFCEVNDTGLRDFVMRSFVNPNTGLLPW